MIVARQLTNRASRFGIAVTLVALSLGACQGLPVANSEREPTAPTQVYGAPRESDYGAIRDDVSIYGDIERQNDTRPYDAAKSMAPVPPVVADSTTPAAKVVAEFEPAEHPVMNYERTEVAPPSPALPRGDADFTPNVARVGYETSSLPVDFPPAAYSGQVDGMHCCNDPFYPPEVWPLRREEFICDGGDQNLRVEVNHDWTVRGLDQEDTIVHYDTLAGGTNVEASNCVCIYAPRFAAVRKTIGLRQTRLEQRSQGVDLGVGPEQQQDVGIATTVLQPLQPGRNIGIDQVIAFQDRNRSGELGRMRLVSGFENGFLPYENIQLIRHGEYDQAEKALLAEGIDAAIAWTDNKSVEVVIDADHPLVQEGVLQPEQFEQTAPQGTPRMRICKIASRRDAQPGEIVHFTIRFDNTGTQRVGNVTIIDNLTTRLEYVPGSAQCSREANFITTENEGESLVLRWEVIDPIEPGEGGIIRFQCRVR